MSEINRAKQNGSRAASNVVEDVKERLTDFVDDAKERGDEWIQQARHRGQKLMAEAQKRGQGAIEDAGTWVADHPAKAICFAVLAGFVLHAIYSRED